MCTNRRLRRLPIVVGLIVISVVVGVLIGAVGIGGVALPPALMWGLGIDHHLAAGTSSFSFIFTGVLGTLTYARNRAVPWRLVGALTIGAAPAALVGTWANGLVPASLALLPIAVLVLGAGVLNLSRGAGTKQAGRRLGLLSAVWIGAAVGFLSALTGTGGPVILIPLLFLAGIPALTAIAAGQAIQIPLMVFAVTGYSVQGNVDFGLGAFIGVLASIGVVIGAKLVLRAPKSLLHRVASVVMLLFGGVLLAMAVWPA